MSDHAEPDPQPPIADGPALPRVLLAALEETASSVCITTADLDEPGPTIVYVNPAYCAMTRRRREDIIGRSPRIMQGPLTDRAVLDRLRSDLTAGRRFSGTTVNYRSTGEPFRISWSIDPVVDEQGATTHFVATQRDVTLEVATERLRHADEAIDNALVAALSAPAEGDTGLGRLVTAIAEGAAAIAGYGRAEVTVHDVVEGAVRGEATAPDRAPSTAAGDPVSSIQMPIVRLDGTSVGVVTVTDLLPVERDIVDRAGLARFAERAASVIAGLGEYQRQRRTALRLQEAMLPRPLVTPAGFEIASSYTPGADGVHVGGDWYDVVETDDAVLLMVGDVSGHGIDAATTMARLQTLSSAELRSGRPVPDVFELLDRMCHDDHTMATFVVAGVDRTNGSVTVWSAGHLPPVAFGAQRGELVRIRPAPPLGHLSGETPLPATTTLGAGDALLLFTDGLVERRAEPLTVGLERLRERLHGSIDDLPDLLDRITDPTGADDDVAIVAIRRLARPDEPET